jgi:nucleotide-binding universal stress UspA family protein
MKQLQRWYMPIIESSIEPTHLSAELTLDRLMVATDFRKYSEPAFQYGLMLAQRFASRIVLAHIVDLSLASAANQVAVGIPLEDLRQDAAENMHRALAQLQAAGVPAISRVVESSNPAEAIVGLATEEGADLIVVGTTARRGLNRATLGSCAEGVIRHAKCPVLTIGPHARQPRNSFASILFASDLQHNSPKKMAAAITICENSCAKVHLYHALENPGADITSILEAEFKHEEALRRLVLQGGRRHCQTDCTVDLGDPAPLILEQARKTSADLIVMGAYPSPHWFGALPEGIVSHVLARAECPVMTVCKN